MATKEQNKKVIKAAIKDGVATPLLAEPVEYRQSVLGEFGRERG